MQVLTHAQLQRHESDCVGLKRDEPCTTRKNTSNLFTVLYLILKNQGCRFSGNLSDFPAISGNAFTNATVDFQADSCKLLMATGIPEKHFSNYDTYEIYSLPQV